MSRLILYILGLKLRWICCKRKCALGIRTRAVESSLRHSRTPALKRLLAEDNINIDEAVQQIMMIKSISPEIHPRFGPALKLSLMQICGYRQLVGEVDQLKRTSFSDDNSQHVNMLSQLWTGLCPDKKLQSRISKQWMEIGFQGDDPKTDFRGMGLLGLLNLIYFATQYTEIARRTLSQCSHPHYGFSFAIVGINLTSLACQLLSGGHLKSHFYNTVQGRPQLQHFHTVYCHLMVDFQKFWFSEKPPSIMEFNAVKMKYHKQLVRKLADPKGYLFTSFCDSNSGERVK